MQELLLTAANEADPCLPCLIPKLLSYLSGLSWSSQEWLNFTLLIALPGRQLGWAKKSHGSVLPRIYIQVKIIQHSGCSVTFVKFMFSRLSSAAEPGKARQHSTALCLQWDFTGDASSSERSLERRLCPAVSSPITYCFAYQRYWLFHTESREL